MGIVGLGSDLVAIARVAKAWQRHGLRFAKKILHPGEIEELRKCLRPELFLAKRFAIKEAAVKALGTGISQDIYFSHLQIMHDSYGRPDLHFHAKAKAIVESLSAIALVTVADENDYAMATVILEKKTPG